MRPFTRAVLALFLAFVLAAALIPTPNTIDARPSRGEKDERYWKPAGMGGGGAMYAPISSPHDPNLVFVSCDMSGFYRSGDGGVTFELVDRRQMVGHTRLAPVFDPEDEDVVYMAGGGESAQNRALKVSTDKGMTFAPVCAQQPWGGTLIRAIHVDIENRNVIYVGVDGGGAYRSVDRGRTFSSLSSIRGTPILFHTAPKDRKRDWRVFIATDEAVYRSEDGVTFHPANDALPSGVEIRDACAGSDKKRTALYVLLDQEDGVFRSVDFGETWTNLGSKNGLNGGDEYRFCDCPANDPTVAYVTNEGTDYAPPEHWTVYRTTDAGESWTATYHGDPRWQNRNIDLGWLTVDTNYGWGGQASGFGVNQGDPRHVYYTNAGELHLTDDAGETWRQGYCTPKKGQGTAAANQWWSNNGLGVTSCWRTVFDPHDNKRVYICYTDIGFARSIDGGETWEHAPDGSPWRNTFYDLVCDPDVAGMLYAAASNTHDIPMWTHVDSGRTGEGGIVISTDFGESWKLLAGGPGDVGGLPNGPCTCIAMDPGSPKAARTFYVSVFSKGVYRSIDSGKTWHRCMDGIDAANTHVYRLTFGPAGTLYLLITASRDGNQFNVNSALYRYDGKPWDPEARKPEPPAMGSWHVVKDDLAYMLDVEISPHDPRTIFLTAQNATGGRIQGGVYRTTDAGQTWTRTLQSYGAYGIAFDPESKRTVYLATTDGIHRSDDGGATFNPLPDFPFSQPTRLIVDPQDTERLWVCTFGGSAFTGATKP